MTAFACYKLENVKTVGYEVLVNRPKTAAYRAPSAPMAAFAVESAVDELAKKIGMDPVEFRIKNAAQEGTRSSYGPVYGPIGIGPTLEAAKNHPHMKAPLGKNQGRGMACGFWFNFGGQTCTDLNIGMDGTVSLAVGTVDVGGSRASLSLVAAEELGIPYEQVKAVVADTASLGYNDMTDGSRGTFSSSMATISAARNAIKSPAGARRADVGHSRRRRGLGRGPRQVAKGEKHGNLAPLSLKEIAAVAGKTGGPIAGHSELVADGAGVSFATHICDVEVDPETGATRILRYTVVQDAGKAVHPTYVEGQYQGGAAQGIGWALNEEYVYGEDGRLQNPGFLDYRIPVCSDLPMIDTQILEIPNPNHPYGVRGVGETSIVPPLAAIANAVSNAAGVRMTHIPDVAATHPGSAGGRTGRTDGRSDALGIARHGRRRQEQGRDRGQGHPGAVQEAGGTASRARALHRARHRRLHRRGDLSRHLVEGTAEGRRDFPAAAPRRRIGVNSGPRRFASDTSRPVLQPLTWRSNWFQTRLQSLFPSAAGI